jgi:hypothetical protein
MDQVLLLLLGWMAMYMGHGGDKAIMVECGCAIFSPKICHGAVP